MWWMSAVITAITVIIVSESEKIQLIHGLLVTVTTQLPKCFWGGCFLGG